ncbi:helix-turn-helix domain-containing protein [Demequina lutea]|uniref:Excisionase family DNA binding protein n=1 Tax=Demequina lutea TaxID=431489 RepID=A0A7Y9ZBD2_9MICO|nr:helix-turn-helix domain-containing protein [Demequina lutea]NYI42051.1 excisionase family DNA binding protein [Demequina lutea]
MLQQTQPATLPASLSIAEVASPACLNCSEDSVRRMIARGDLPAYRVGPRMIRIKRRDLERIMRPVTRIDLASASGGRDV